MKKIYLLLLIAFACFSATESKAQCTAAFSYTAAGDTATFTDMSTASFGSVVTWGWNFGDGGFSASQNPVHTYANCGVYNVSLTIFTSGFCSNTFTSTVTVNGGITPSFTYTVDTTNGNVTFQGQPLGLNLHYVWNYGDGTYDSTFATMHTFPTGTYNVCLTVGDNAGICSNTVCNSVVVYVAPPVCTTTFTTNDNGNGNVNFQAAPFSFSRTYNWDFGDGATGTGALTLHTYTTYGTYIACLTAVDSSTMCVSHSCDTIVLARDTASCSVGFNYFNNNGQVGFLVNSTSTNNSYSWDFADGNTGTGAATTDTYAASGIYYVCLTTNNPFDVCSSTFCDSVNVVISGIEELATGNFSLKTYPNPMNDQTTISYSLVSDADVQLSVTDILGKTISVVKSGHLPKGNYSQVWDANGIKAGIYLLHLKVDDRMETKKLIITK